MWVAERERRGGIVVSQVAFGLAVVNTGLLLALGKRSRSAQSREEEQDS